MNHDTIPVLYRPEMSAANNRSYSPSAGKPRAVVEDWLKHRLPIQTIPFEPATRDMIALAHKRSYVDGVLDGQVPNGFRNTSAEVAATLPYTVGSMIAAAQLAIALKERNEHSAVTCSPTSGFHHAHYDHAAGFCTFNGLVITAMYLKRVGLAKRVGIIDCDFHYGDGTDELIARLGLNFIEHWSCGREYSRPDQAEDAISAVTRNMKRMSRSCDVVLYQAGADAHIDDPLGGMLTTEQMRRREVRAFRTASSYALAVAWNLAGGYQVDRNGSIEPVLALHRQTMEVCVKHYVPGGGHRQ